MSVPTPSPTFLQRCGSTAKSATYTAGRGIKSGAIGLKDAAVEDPKRAIKVAVGAGVGVALVTVGGPALVSAVGFGAKGVTGLSLAAKAQSVLYGAYTSGAFSVLQSIGAAGFSTATTAVATTAGAAGGAAIANSKL